MASTKIYHECYITIVNSPAIIFAVYEANYKVLEQVRTCVTKTFQEGKNRNGNFWHQTVLSNSDRKRTFNNFVTLEMWQEGVTKCHVTFFTSKRFIFTF